jgi:predicted TIM-barrel fold metal-dependent hydrolase
MPLDEAPGQAGATERPAGQTAKSGAPIQYRIVDADAHVNPPHEFWREYLPAHLRELAPVIEEGEDCDWIVFEGKRRKLNLSGAQAGRKGQDFKMEGKRSDMRVGGWMPAARIADMDEDGMDASVLFGGGPLGTANSELYIESFHAYNRWLADFCAYDRRRLIGVAYLPMRDVDETIGMMRAAAKLGFRSVNIPAFPQASDGISTSSKVAAIQTAQGAALSGNPTGELQYNDPVFDAFWAEAVELDMTLTFHLGGRIPRFGEKKHFLPDMVMSKLAMAEPIGIAIFGGVFQRFPKLRFASIESGVGWMSWMAEYMDRTWEKQRYWMDSTLTQPPSVFMDQNVYASFINDRIGILNRNLPGGKNIMWSSDYPHSETTYPNSHKVIERDFVGIPDADKHEIICERARRLFSVG